LFGAIRAVACLLSTALSLVAGAHGFDGDVGRMRIAEVFECHYAGKFYALALPFTQATLLNDSEIHLSCGYRSCLSWWGKIKAVQADAVERLVEFLGF
jgi:hypothetical protein